MVEEGVLVEFLFFDFFLDDYFKLIVEWLLIWKDGKFYVIVNCFGYYGIIYNYNKFLEEDVLLYDILFDLVVKGCVVLFDWFFLNMGCMFKYNGNF